MNKKLSYNSRSYRIGLIVPSSNTSVEPDFVLLAPKGVTIHSVRSGGYDVNTVPDSDEMRQYVRQSIDQHLQDLMDGRMDIIAYGCTSATLSDGPEFDAEFCQQLQEKTGKPAVTTAGALVVAIQATGAEKVAFTSPYVKLLSQEAVSYLERSGINVVNEVTFEQELSSVQQNALTPQDAYDMALKADHPQAEAIVISCTDYRAVEAIPFIEEVLEKPVITSNQALMYACLERLNLSGNGVSLGGRLFNRNSNNEA